MTRTTIFSIFVAGFAVILVDGCKKSGSASVAPSVATTGISSISFNTATCGAIITNAGSAAITASGICWSNSNSTPGLSTDSFSKGTTASGSFTASINNLKANTLYYVRAYATSSAGTGYGNVETFSTTVDTTKVTFTYNGQAVTYGIIISATTGRQWMDRNLGASRVAVYANDSLAFGDHFQWGRLVDGHQVRTADTTSTRSTTDVPSNSKFILTSTYNPSYDWRNPSSDNLWQGSHGTNNPCPSGWHVPVEAEWAAESGVVDSASGLALLKLTLAGIRWLDGSFLGAYSAGQYWSSTASTGTGNALYFSLSATKAKATAGTQRGIGNTIRCIKD